MRRSLSLLCAALAVTAAAVLTTGLHAPHAAAAATIESAYNVPGPYAVKTGTAKDSHGRAYDLYYPADYAALGFKSPILTWGNGANSLPRVYSVLFTRLVSWGFTIVASTQANTGGGSEINNGAKYLVAQDSVKGSPFYRNLNTAEVGAFGHSEGAAGAINAVASSPSLYSTVLTFSLPSPFVSLPNSDCPTLTACVPHTPLVRCPAFLISTHGTWDSVLSSPAIETAYYNSIWMAPATLGIVAEGMDHTSIQNPGTNSGHPGPFLGYVTAWFMYRLRGDTTAAKAFTGPDPELTSNANWPGSLTK
jgi:hypothetical protein